MPSLDYLAITGPDCTVADEIANSERTSTYMYHGVRAASIAGVSIIGCDGLDDLIGDLCPGALPTGPFTTPEGDNAPWYDPLVPESAGFAGLLINSIDGLDSTPVTRDVTQLAAGGAVLGPLVETERAITVVAELHGVSCCSVAYGLRWLTSVLQRRCAPTDCDHSDLLFLQSCPADIDLCTGDSIDERVRSPWRIASRVGLIEGPVITNRAGANCTSCGCNPMIEVEFSFTAGRPSLYLPGVDVLEATDLLPEVTDDCEDLHWTCAPAQDCEATEFLFDIACGTLPPPPTPQVPVNCLCEPLAVHRLMVPLTFDVPERFTASLSVTLTAGERPLRNVALRLFAPGDDGCGDDYPVCDVLASLGVTYVPPNSTLHVDGVRQRSWVEAVDGTRFTATRLIFNASGSNFQWLEVPCGGGYCLSIQSDAFNTYDGATVAVTANVREG